MRLLRRSSLPTRIAIGLASFAAVFGVAKSASAQPVITLSSMAPTPTWYSGPNGTGSIIGARNTGHNPFGVSFSDCENNYSMVFTLSINLTAPGSSGSDQLQAWAGSGDCTQQSNRGNVNGTIGSCVPLSPPTVINALSMTVALNARDIALAYSGQSPPGTGGVYSSYAPAADDSACFRQTSSAGLDVSFFFLPFPGGNAQNDPGYNFTGPVTTQGGSSDAPVIDMVGPIAPSGGSIGIGDTELIVSWAPAVDSDTVGFQLLCDPNPPDVTLDASPAIDAQCSNATDLNTVDSSTGGDDSAVSARILDGPEAGDDAATGADASSDSGDDAATDGSASDASTTSCGVPDFDAAVCGSSPLVDMQGKNGTQVPAYYMCGAGLGSTTSTSYTPKNLTDGVEYTFAVAGLDASGNLGGVYVIGCSAPAKIRDFWTTYRQDGGGAGGAFCALDGVGMPFSSTIFCAGLGITAVTFIRRRRSRRR